MLASKSFLDFLFLTMLLIIIPTETTAPTYPEMPYMKLMSVDSGKRYEHITQCKALSLYDTGVTAEYDDKLITLSTCEYSRKNGRMVVVAKRIAAPSAEVGSDEA